MGKFRCQACGKTMDTANEYHDQYDCLQHLQSRLEEVERERDEARATVGHAIGQMGDERARLLAENRVLLRALTTVSDRMKNTTNIWPNTRLEVEDAIAGAPRTAAEVERVKALEADNKGLREALEGYRREFIARVCRTGACSLTFDLPGCKQCVAAGGCEARAALAPTPGMLTGCEEYSAAPTEAKEG